MRIAKFIADAGICSRREAERMIDQGRVQVNGLAINSPALNVTEQDKVLVDGRAINIQNNTERLWLYHKPVGLITTHKDPQNRPTVFDSLPKWMPRVISVGRLDINSEGLLLLTNSGELARRLESPKSKITRTYHVKVFGAGEEIDICDQELFIDQVRYRPKLIQKIDTKSRSRLNSWYLVELEEGKNREVRKIFNHFGYQVVKLIRVQFGQYSLANLKAGEVREVKIYEDYLREI